MEYGKMATVYDKLMGDAPYDLWLDFVKELLADKSVNLKDLVVADYGCGTGEMTRRLAAETKHVYGVDLSSEMLTEAAAKIEPNLGRKVTWLQQDVSALEGISEIDLAVSFFDVLNYVVEEAALERYIKNVYESLTEDGCFIFDVHSMHQIENHYLGETFAVVLDTVSYIWFCTGGEYPGEMHHDLTFFVQDGEKYERFDECHHQRTHTVSYYVELLKKVGFRKVSWYSGAHKESLYSDENAPRIFFLAEK